MSRSVWLSIETAGTHLGVAIHDAAHPAGPALARFFQATPGKQSDLLIPTIDRLMKKARLPHGAIAGIVVDNGPGSFTGVRVGVAAARALAQAFGVPLVGVSGLEALAWAAARTLRLDSGTTVAARIPALAGEAYHAVYRWERGRLRPIAKPAWTSEKVFEAALRRVRGPLAVALIERAGKEELNLPASAIVFPAAAPDPSDLAAIGAAAAGPKPSARRFPVEKVVPVYLQPSWAERQKGKK
ncbi:MAG: tRNA (adenosine(37)-N6)-threonylcarbamoyltransferase complex dimerization subunit type 1 TsaB [Elusimicrobia bacterium]|nr:tRNA (adenosine(37)-N6)-threonylcarbamoyltransferase complex dimerization subunit type 1 TsaB [Elusimicrobiota bacterium]